MDRHRPHVSRDLTRATEARGVTEADSLLAKVRDLETDARRLASLCEKQGDYRAALVALQQIRETLKFLLDVARERERVNVRNLVERLSIDIGIPAEDIEAEMNRLAALVSM